LGNFVPQTNLVTLVSGQGDQIGRILAHWAAVYFGQFFENYRSSPNFWSTIFHGKSDA
jgi:hypothetical protein